MGCCPFWFRRKVIPEQKQQQHQVTLAPLADDPNNKIIEGTPKRSSEAEMKVPNDLTKQQLSIIGKMMQESESVSAHSNSLNFSHLPQELKVQEASEIQEKVIEKLNQSKMPSGIFKTINYEELFKAQ